MQEVKTGKGALRYRMPNILEINKFIREAKMYDTGTSFEEMRDEIVQRLPPLLDYTDLSDVKSFEDLNKDPDNFFMPLVEISNEIIMKIMRLHEKKI